MSLPEVTSTKSGDRFWIRRDRPLPFLWEALIAFIALLLLTLYTLGPFASNDVEASVRSETRATLNEQGYGWVQVETSGQDVVLNGVQPAAHGGDGAIALAHSVACPTWAGPLTCPITVVGRFSEPAAPAALTTAPATDTGLTLAAACEKSFADIVAQSQIEFASSSAEIRGSGSVLDALAKAAANCDGVIRIEGHTDSAGSASLNVALSAARANAVAAALVDRGLPQARLQAQGFGASKPIADNSTADGRAKNRRIEFRVIQKEPN